MQHILRTTQTATAILALALPAPGLAQTLPTPSQITALTDRQCVRLLRMLAEEAAAPTAITEAEAAVNGAAGACDSLSAVWDEVDAGLLDQEAANLLAAALRQAGLDPAAPAADADVAAADAAAARQDRRAAAAARAAGQAMPIPREILRLEDRQCVRLLRAVAAAEGAPASVVEADRALSGAEGACRALAQVWRAVDPSLLDAEATQLLAASMRQAGIEVTAAALRAEGAGPPAAALTEDASAAATTTETVTEDTARRSDEDFSAAAPAGGGLSALETALLVGAGALVAGAIVSNNRKVVSSTPDRVVVEQADGQLRVLKDDNALLRRPGAEVATQTFADGSTRSVVTRDDGTQIVTIRDAELRVLKRVSVAPDGAETVLIDDTAPVAPVEVALLPAPAAPAPALDPADAAALRAALAADSRAGRTFTLAQVRDLDRVRKLAPAIAVDTITFETGSAAIRPTEAEELAVLGQVVAETVARDAAEIFLVEGHTDAVGGAGMNLLLSDRRAESVALALTEYFGVPPENLVVQGYGESDLAIPTEAAERLNRRAVVRRITPLLRD